MSAKGAKGGKGGRGKASGKKATSRSAKAGLQFPVGRVARFLKKGINHNYYIILLFNNISLLLYHYMNIKTTPFFCLNLLQ